jgi:hypothetical protein
LIIAKNENVSKIDRKGKPSGNGRENGTLAEAKDETNDIDNMDTSTLEVKHHNRQLHKGWVYR